MQSYTQSPEHYLASDLTLRGYSNQAQTTLLAKAHMNQHPIDAFHVAVSMEQAAHVRAAGAGVA